MIHMRILKEFGAYCPGETASFLERDAVNLEKKGFAVPVVGATRLDINPKSSDLDFKAMKNQWDMNDKAAAKMARILGQPSFPSANGYDVGAEPAPEEK